jgi:hypothetical protein
LGVYGSLSAAPDSHKPSLKLVAGARPKTSSLMT